VYRSVDLPGQAEIRRTAYPVSPVLSPFSSSIPPELAYLIMLGDHLETSWQFR
jgi:hypothetical protein